MNKFILAVAALAIAVAIAAMAPIVIDDLDHPTFDKSD